MAFPAPILSLTKRSTTAELPAITSYCTVDLLPSASVLSQVPFRLCSFVNAAWASSVAAKPKGWYSRNAAKSRALNSVFARLIVFLPGETFRACLRPCLPVHPKDGRAFAISTCNGQKNSNFLSSSLGEACTGLPPLVFDGGCAHGLP